MPATPHHSLVKYLPPTLVHFTKDAGKTKKKLPPVTDKKSTQTEDILNSILPPREWTDDGQLWVQYVSSTPATRVDVIGLQELLDQRLQQQQARETGICPIREELYAQCFGACWLRVCVAGIMAFVWVVLRALLFRALQFRAQATLRMGLLAVAPDISVLCANQI